MPMAPKSRFTEASPLVLDHDGEVALYETTATYRGLRVGVELWVKANADTIDDLAGVIAQVRTKSTSKPASATAAKAAKKAAPTKDAAKKARKSPAKKAAAKKAAPAAKES